MNKEEFKAKRLELGLTQVELEDKLGLSPNTGHMISRYETGKTKITKKTELLLETLISS